MTEEFVINDPELIKEFVNEFKEHLQNMDQNLLDLEKNPSNQETVREIFRAAHSIKGGSSYLGLNNINKFTHHLENLLDKIRKNQIRISSGVMDILFHSVDILKQQIEGFISDGKEGSVDVDPTIKEIEEILNGGGEKEEKAKKKKKEKTAVQKSPDEKYAAQFDGIKAEVGVEDFIHTSGQHLSVIESALKDLNDGAETVEVFDKFHRAFNGLKIAAMIMQYDSLKDLMDQAEIIINEFRHGNQKITSSTKELLGRFYDILFHYVDQKRKDPKHAVDLTELLNESKSISKMVASVPVDSPVVEKKSQISSDSSKNIQSEQTIRVGESRLDQMMSLIGELIIVRNRFNILNRKIHENMNDLKVKDDLDDASATLSRISNELQLLIMDVRMIPVSTIFNKFPRMVRDFAKARGKKIDLEMSGEETSLDKTVIEKIGDPLVHLVRNAIDHGIESVEMRLKQEKSETGKVKLSARNEGENVIIEIEDDGKGMDHEIIKKKAVEKGVISQERANAMGIEESIELIFEPGFSTAEVVTDVSGRGVGMDVVRNNIKKLNGEIAVKTIVGKGSLISIRLPMSLAIMKVLMVGVGNSLYAFPLSSVETTVKVTPNEVSSISGKGKAIILHGKTLIINCLRDVLNLSGNDCGESNNGKLSIVVVSVGDKRLGIVVDQFYEQQEIVVKPLENMLNSSGISGSAILGDGRIALVMDIGEIFKMALKTETAG